MLELLAPDGLGLEKLKQNLVDMNDEEVKKWLAKIIPTYCRNE
jgi:hypothetical protein